MLPNARFQKREGFWVFFFFFFCSFFRKFLLERWAARSKRCVFLFRVCRAERRSPRSILAHAQAHTRHAVMLRHTRHAVMLGFSAAAHPTKFTLHPPHTMTTRIQCTNYTNIQEKTHEHCRPFMASCRQALGVPSSS